MPVLKPREATTVIPRKGGQAHITSLTTPRRTACGKSCDGWTVAIVDLTDPATRGCLACKKAVFLRVR